MAYHMETGLATPSTRAWEPGSSLYIGITSRIGRSSCGFLC